MPLSSVDMYRKVPVDLLEGTKRGQLLSLIAVFSMATLFILETRDFLIPKATTQLSLDKNINPRIRVNFNITMMDLSCDYTVVDVVSVLGTEQNITQNVQKWSLDQAGVRQRFVGRNKFQKDIAIQDTGVTETLDELHANGEDAVYLDRESLEMALEENDYVFVDFYAGWCWHCRALEPTWEALAEMMNDVANEVTDEELAELRARNEKRRKLKEAGHTTVPRDDAMDDDIYDLEYEPEYTDEEFAETHALNKPVLIAKVDCVEHKDYCEEMGIYALPTLRLFVDGEPYKKDYDGDRTILAFTNFLANVEHEFDGEEGKLDRTEAHARRKANLPTNHEWRKNRHLATGHPEEWEEDKHPGCQISGSLMVDRVPGNFHIRASSSAHTFMPTMTNVSHEVHHLSFGDPDTLQKLLQIDIKPERIAPFDGNVYVTHHLHQAYHHHLKVVTTNFESTRGMSTAYQVLTQTQLSAYHADSVPEAKFIYDLSPVAVTMAKQGKRWYDYLTSLMAIVGGAFTMFGLLESGIGAVSSKKRN